MRASLILVAFLFCGTRSETVIAKLKEDRDIPDPPPHHNTAATARYMAHYGDWGVIATTSTLPNISGRPFPNIISFVDGPMDNSTGIPYFFVMADDATPRDVAKNPFVSLSISEHMLPYCQKEKYDAEDPRCARLVLSGKMVNVTGSEKKFALNCLFARHPSMKIWSHVHSFWATKLEIDFIWLVDYFGGAISVSLDDYFSVHL